MLRTFLSKNPKNQSKLSTNLLNSIAVFNIDNNKNILKIETFKVVIIFYNISIFTIFFDQFNAAVLNIGHFFQ